MVVSSEKINSKDGTTVQRLYYTFYIFKIKIFVILKFYKNGIVTIPNILDFVVYIKQCQ